MTRRCSHCSNNGHNSRTCPTRGAVAGPSAGVMLFGVRLTDGSMMKKSASMGNLSAHLHSSSASPNPGSPDPAGNHVHVPDGYLSDDTAHRSSHRRGERKKGVPWTEEEHRLFLIGLQKLGRGDWRGIARNYVTSRTPTQVASHAQKHFMRQSNTNRRKRRSSLFDMAPDLEIDPPAVQEEPILPPAGEADTSNAIPSLPPPAREANTSNPMLSLPPPAREANTSNPRPSLDLSLSSEVKPMETSPQEPPKVNEEYVIPPAGFPVFIPAYFQAPIPVPVPIPIWPQIAAAQPLDDKCPETTSHHRVLKPIPLLPKEPVNVNELVGISQLSLIETEGGSNQKETPSLSQKLLGEPSRQSAFHVSSGSASGSGISTGKNSPIQAV